MDASGPLRSETVKPGPITTINGTHFLRSSPKRHNLERLPDSWLRFARVADHTQSELIQFGGLRVSTGWITSGLRVFRYLIGLYSSKLSRTDAMLLCTGIGKYLI